MGLKTTIAVTVWLGCIVASMGALQLYANTPGQAGSTPRFYSLEMYTPMFEPYDGARIILFLHERCPCTRATIEEIAQNKHYLRGARIEVVFSGPATSTDERESMRKLVSDKLRIFLPHDDPDGSIARSFGAYTSGFTVMYHEDGSLHFSGGVTPSRAHAGPCPGRTALRTLMESRTGSSASAPVFGCPLFSDDCEIDEYCGEPAG